MSSATAYLLVIHGSRDARLPGHLERLIGQIQSTVMAFESLAGTICQRHSGQSMAVLTKPISFQDNLWLEIASLSCHPLTLTQQIIQSAHRANAQGYQQLMVVPLFLQSGVHVNEDIPQAIAQATVHFPRHFSLDLRPHIGSHPGMSMLLEDQFDHQFLHLSTPYRRIVLAHGTRWPQGNAQLEQIAQQLSAYVAYCSTAPNLENQVKAALQAGYRKIAILPHFLFSGTITDAIAQQIQPLVNHYSQEYREPISLHWGQPIGMTPDFSRLMCQILEP